jgi:hypothetical protein
MEYIVFVKINGDWEEVARVEATDHADAILKGEQAMPPQYKGRAMGLKPTTARPADPPLPPGISTPEQRAAKPN